MQEAGVVLVTAAVVFIGAAIAGGGLEAAGWKIPSLLKSPPRQLGLGAFGAVLLVIGLLLVSGADDDGGSMVEIPDQTSDRTKTERPTPTGFSEDSPTETSNAETPSGQPATGEGTVAHCRFVSVSIEEVVRTDGKLHMPVGVTNGANNVSIQLPPLDDVHLVDADGHALSIDRFANLGSTWGIGQEVRPGSTFSSSVVFQDVPDRSNLGSVEIVNIRAADDPFMECSVRVEGVRLP